MTTKKTTYDKVKTYTASIEGGFPLAFRHLDDLVAKLGTIEIKCIDDQYIALRYPLQEPQLASPFAACVKRTIVYRTLEEKKHDV